jgi:hypothetical protein
MTRWQAIAAVTLSAICLSARSLEIEQADSKYRDKHYQLTLITVVDAPRDRVQAVLRDYYNYPQLDARILEANVLSRPAAHEVLLFTKLRACFGVFCRTVKRVEHVQEQDNDMLASVVPEQSEITSGETRTQLTALDGRTRISYTTSMVPGFWIPSFIGRPLMLRTLRDASIDLFRRVEQQAQMQVLNPAPGQAVNQSKSQ